MLRKYVFIGIIIILLCSAYALYNPVQLDERHIEETESRSSFIDQSGIEIIKIDNNVWVYTSYLDYKGVKTPSNGLVIVTDEGLLLVDTPWNNHQTEALLKIIKERFKQPIVKAIITHAHSDRIGGIEVLKRAHIKTYSTSLTQSQAVKNGYPKPENALESGESTNIGTVSVEIYYPGEGHSKDNSVVWIPSKKILFAGCLVKSLDESALGGSEDTNFLTWSATLESLKKKFKTAKIVIPGHGDWGDSSLIDHTLKLTNKQK